MRPSSVRSGRASTNDDAAAPGAMSAPSVAKATAPPQPDNQPFDKPAMSTNAEPFFFQDELGGVLSTPLGTEHIPPMTQLMLNEAAALSASEGSTATVAPPKQGRSWTSIGAGGALLVLACLGLYAWLR